MKNLKKTFFIIVVALVILCGGFVSYIMLPDPPQPGIVVHTAM